MVEDEAAFELVPFTPVRKLEREMQELKSQMHGRDQSKLVGQVIEILKMNQAIVDQLTTKQTDLLVKLTETNEKLGKLCVSLNDLVEGLSTASEEPEAAAPAEHAAPASDTKLDKIIEQNAALINTLNVLGKEMGKMSEGKQ